jgi:hypothetical protein
MSWQRTNIQAAATYLRERIAAGASDVRTKVVYEGLLEVLDPNRRTLRVQRELVAATKDSVPVPVERDRRASERRGYQDRRQINIGSPTGVNRRKGEERRKGRDRRRT